MKIHMEGAIQKVLDIFEADDGRTFEEKKKAVIAYIETQEDKLLAERVLKAAINHETGKHVKEKFWSVGNISKSDEHICLRMVQESDKNNYFELQKETGIVKSMLKEESYQNMMWNEHIQDKGIRIIAMKIEDIKQYCLEKHKADETYPFGEVPICYKLKGKIFAQVYPYEWDYKITLKCTREMGEFYRMVYPEKVVRGYHCPPVQQPYWNTIYLDDFPDDELLNMIDYAYETVFHSFSRKIQRQILEDT